MNVRMEDLPEEIVDEIIQRIPKSSLIEVSEVCQLWNGITSRYISPILSVDDFSKAAAQGDLLSISRSKKHHNQVNLGLYYACVGRNQESMNFMLKHGATDYYFGLKGACLGGDVSIATRMINLGGRSYNNDCMSLACSAGNKEIVELLIKKGWGYIGALSSGLISACGARHYDLIDFMIKSGADRWLAIYHFNQQGDHEIVEYLLSSHRG